MPRALCPVASIFLNRLDWRRLNPRLIRQDPPLHNSPKSRRPRQSEEASTFCLIWLAVCLSPCQPLPGLEMFVQETNRFPSSVPIISALGAEVRLHDGIKSRSLRERRIEACLPSRCAYLNSQRRKTLFCAAPLALSFAPSSLARSLSVSQSSNVTPLHKGPSDVGKVARITARRAVPCRQSRGPEDGRILKHISAVGSAQIDGSAPPHHRLHRIPSFLSRSVATPKLAE